MIHLGLNQTSIYPTDNGDNFNEVCGILVIENVIDDVRCLVVMHGAFCVGGCTQLPARCTWGTQTHSQAVHCAFLLIFAPTSGREEVFPN